MIGQKWSPLFGAVCAAVLISSAGSVSGAERIEKITLRPVGDFVELSIPVAGHRLCEHFTLEPDGDKPFRIVLDFCDATHALRQKNFSELPVTVIDRIRTSQYAIQPQMIVRVVLDMSGPVTYTVRPGAEQVTVAIADPQHASFSMWESGSGQRAAVELSTVKSPAPIENDPVPMEMTTRHDKESVGNHRSHVADASRKPSAASALTESAHINKPVGNATPSIVVAARTSARATSSFSETSGLDHKYGEIAKSGAEEQKDQPATDNQSEHQHVFATRLSKPSVFKKEAVAPEVSQTTATIPENTDVVDAPTSYPRIASKPFVLPLEPLVLAPNHFRNPASQTPSAVTESKSAFTTPVVPGLETASETEQHINAGNEWASLEEPDVAAGGVQQFDLDDPEADMSLIERLKTKFFGNQRMPQPYTTSTFDLNPSSSDPSIDALGPPTPGQGLSRAALLERIRQAERKTAMRSAMGAPLPQEVNQRVDIFYDDMRRRDPFEQLLNGLRSGFVSDNIPNVENLRMVGILRDDYDAIALMEDMEGFSFVLREGDPVENGEVIAIEDERVLFKVNDYGWLRTVTLRMSPRGMDPSKMLGVQSGRGDNATEQNENNQ